MAEHAVVIAGGGPTGMMLAAELAPAQVDVVIVERRATPDPDRSRAGGLHARTIRAVPQAPALPTAVQINRRPLAAAAGSLDEAHKASWERLSSARGSRGAAGHRAMG